jgi:hypothetical protein
MEEIGVTVVGRDRFMENLVYVDVAQWTADFCTMVDLGVLPIACHVIARTPCSPWLVRESVSGMFEPVSSNVETGIYEFRVPEGVFKLIPQPGFLDASAYALKVEARPGPPTAVDSDWRVGSLRIDVDAARDDIGHIMITKEGQVMRLPLSRAAINVAVSAGSYDVRALDHSRDVISEKRITVVGEQALTVVLP